ALRDLQRALAQVLRPSAARQTLAARLPRRGPELRDVRAALPRAEAGTRADSVFSRRRDVELVQLADSRAVRHCARGPRADRVGPRFRRRARAARARLLDAVGTQELD